MRTLFPGARLGYCLRHAITKLPGTLTALASPVRKALRSPFHTLWFRARQWRGLRVFALGQQLPRFADHITTTAGSANGERAQHASQRGVAVEGGRLPTADWGLNLQILPSGGFR
jgi:hypothetical protein